MLTMHMTPKPDMLAVELFHYSCKTIPMTAAQMIARDLGDAHARFRRSSHWYGEIEIVDADEGLAEKIPFSLAMFDTEDASLQVRFGDEERLARALGYYVASNVTVIAH